VLTSCFKEFSSQDIITLLQSYLGQNINVPEDNVILKIDMFPETYKKIIAMMIAILENDDDKTVDQYILGIMSSIFPPTLKPLVKYNYAQYLVDNIHFQLSEFEASK